MRIISPRVWLVRANDFVLFIAVFPCYMDVMLLFSIFVDFFLRSSSAHFLFSLNFLIEKEREKASVECEHLLMFVFISKCFILFRSTFRAIFRPFRRAVSNFVDSSLFVLNSFCSSLVLSSLFTFSVMFLMDKISLDVIRAVRLPNEHFT